MKKILPIFILIALVVFMGANCKQEIDSANVNKEPVMANVNTTAIAEGAIYTNADYEFNFYYDPENYEVTEEKSQGGALGEEGDLFTLKAKTEDNCPETVTIFISPATLDQELEDLEFRIDGETTAAVVSGEDATQRQGTLTENLPACGSEVIELVFENKGDVYIMRADKDSEDLLNELLTSFQFFN